MTMDFLSDLPNATDLTCSETLHENKTSFIYQGNVYGGIPETLTINAIAWVVSSVVIILMGMSFGGCAGGRQLFVSSQ